MYKGLCYEHRCIGTLDATTPQLQVKVNSIWKSCPENGGSLEFEGTTGTLRCKPWWIHCGFKSSMWNTTVCQSEDGFSSTSILSTASKSCTVGIGQETRKCEISTAEAGAAWGPVNTTNCALVYCESEDGYPKTAVDSIASKNCISGVGNQTRPCIGKDIWGAEDTSTCIQACTSDGEFPQTMAGSNATIACTIGIGLQSRRCSNESLWQAVDDSTCITIQCLASDGYPTVYATRTASKACEIGVGTTYITCNITGHFNLEDSSSCILPCSSINGYPVTPGNSTASKSCDRGIGIETMFCDSKGNWSRSDTSQCLMECLEDNGYSRSSSSMVAEKDCITGIGKQTRYCNADAKWEEEDISLCEVTTSTFTLFFDRKLLLFEEIQLLRRLASVANITLPVNEDEAPEGWSIKQMMDVPTNTFVGEVTIVDQPNIRSSEVVDSIFGSISDDDSFFFSEEVIALHRGTADEPTGEIKKVSEKFEWWMWMIIGIGAFIVLIAAIFIIYKCCK